MKALALLWLVAASGCRARDVGGATPPAIGTGAPQSAGAHAIAPWSHVVSRSGDDYVSALAAQDERFALLIHTYDGKDDEVTLDGATVSGALHRGYCSLVMGGAGGRTPTIGVLPFDGCHDETIAFESDALLMTIHGRVREDLGTGTIDWWGYSGVMSMVDVGRARWMRGVVGTIDDVTSTGDGKTWIAGASAAREPKCDGHWFVAHSVGGAEFESSQCGNYWSGVRIRSVDDDVVLCMQQLGSAKVGTVEISRRGAAGVVLARIDPTGTPKWVRSVNDLGWASCSSIAVTPDGDIVVAGLASENADFTENAFAKGMKERPSDDASQDRLWIARYAGNGTRRWARDLVGKGEPPSVAAGGDGIVVLTSELDEPIDLGNGPEGPGERAGRVGVVQLDDQGHSLGWVPIGREASDPRIAVDDQGGVILAVSITGETTIAGMKVTPEPGAGVDVALLRFPPPVLHPKAAVPNPKP